MCTRHCTQIDRLAIFTGLQLTVTLIVSEAVFDANNDPAVVVSGFQSRLMHDPQGVDVTTETYQRFVKTTPKPNATKKSKGELVGPLPL